MRQKNNRDSVMKWAYEVGALFKKGSISIDVLNATINVVYIYNDYVLSIQRDVSCKSWNEISSIISDILIDIYYGYEWNWNTTNYHILWWLLHLDWFKTVTEYMKNITSKMQIKATKTSLLYSKL